MGQQQESREDDRSKRVYMFQRIESYAARICCSVIAKVASDKPVCGFVHCDRNNYRYGVYRNR